MDAGSGTVFMARASVLSCRAEPLVMPLELSWTFSVKLKLFTGEDSEYCDEDQVLVPDASAQGTVSTVEPPEEIVVLKVGVQLVWQEPTLQLSTPTPVSVAALTVFGLLPIGVAVTVNVR